MAWEAADVKIKCTRLWLWIKITTVVIVALKQYEDAYSSLLLRHLVVLTKLCKGEKVTHVGGEIRDINICSISGSVYMSTVQEATVMSLCTFWTTPIMLWVFVISRVWYRLSSSLLNNIPMMKNSNKDLCLSKGQPTSLSYSGYSWCLSVFQSSPDVLDWLLHFGPGKTFFVCLNWLCTCCHLRKGNALEWALVVNIAAERHVVFRFSYQEPPYPGACKCKLIYCGYIYMCLNTPLIFNLLKFINWFMYFFYTIYTLFFSYRLRRLCSGTSL